MAVKRRVSFLSQQRVDTPDMRAIESAVANDFDELIKAFVTGTSQGYVLRGFEISMSGAIGGAASALSMVVDPGALFHVTSGQSGTVLLVPSGTPPQQLNSATNTIVDGAFAPSGINYVGIEYERFIDDSTSSQVYLWNPTTNNETIKNAPRAIVLRYRIKITTSSWAPNVLPIAVVVTNSGNNVESITDARYRLTRLGTGGASPNATYTYPWTAQPEGRTENPSSSSSNSVNPFRGGDKMLGSLKDWMDAVMSSIQEIKGTTFWYGLSSSGSLESLRRDLGNTLITGKGHIEHQLLAPGQVNWDEDIHVRVIGSRLDYKILANPSSTDVSLDDDEVAYLNLVRGVEILPSLIFTQGSPTVTSVGGIAWTADLQGGDWIKVATENDSGYYQIQTKNSLTQVTLTENYQETSTGALGAKSKYSFGVYQTVASPSTNRHVQIAARNEVPEGENIWWFAARSDNGDSISRVYLRFLGKEIQQGEEIEISDTSSEQLIRYMGATSEVDDSPEYSSNNVVVDGTSLTEAIGDLDAAAGNSSYNSDQDRSAKLIGGGVWNWNLSSTELSFTADAYLQLPGIADDRNTIDSSSSPIVLANDGDVAYVTVNRSAGVTSVITVSVVDNTSLVLNEDVFVIARRVGNDVLVGRASFLLKDSEYLEIDGALADINRRLSQLKLQKHESSESKIRVLGSDFVQLEGSTLVQEQDGLQMSFGGAVIDFSTGTILQQDDLTALGINFTPFSIPLGQYLWYSVGAVSAGITADNRQEIQIQITPALSANATQANAPYPELEGDKKLGLVQVLNDGGTVKVVAVNRLGVGSGGGGSAKYKESSLANGQASLADIANFKVDPTKSRAFSSEYSIFRSNMGNSEDTAFYTNLGDAFNNDTYLVSTQPDGKILVGGSFDDFDGNTRNLIVRLNSDGTEDAAFYTNGGGFTGGHTSTSATQSDGKIVIGGFFNQLGINTRNQIVRLNSDGTEDTAFYTPLNVGVPGGFYAMINKILLQPDGKILVGGNFTSVSDDYSQNHLVRLNSNGSKDTAFYTNLNGAFNGNVYDIGLQSDNKIVVVGDYTIFYGSTTRRICKINPDGTQDMTFWGNVDMGFNFAARGVAIQSDDKIVVVGDFTSYNSNARNYIARLNSDGTEDAAFYSNLGTALDAPASTVKIQTDGKILVGGSFTSFNGNSVKCLVRLNPDGTEDTYFSTAIGSGFDNGSVSAIDVDSSGNITIGGSFTSFNGNTRNRIVRLNPDGTDLVKQGTIRGLYRTNNPASSKWEIGALNSLGDDVGVEFSMTDAGQMQYTSTSIPGSVVESFIRFIVSKL